MKIHIGKYKSWIGPYQIADVLRYVGVNEDKCHDVGAWLDKKVPGLKKACEWVASKRHRKIKIHIDNFDTWSLDHTLAMIIAPCLKKLKETQHGAGQVDDEDVPELLRVNGKQIGENGEVDDHWFVRWDYVLDEMIFAFTALIDENDYEDKLHAGTAEFRMVPVDKDGIEIPREGAKLFIERKLNTSPAGFDLDLYMDYNARLQNGYRLFGKYYRGLWT